MSTHVGCTSFSSPMAVVAPLLLASLLLAGIRADGSTGAGMGGLDSILIKGGTVATADWLQRAVRGKASFRLYVFPRTPSVNENGGWVAW